MNKKYLIFILVALLVMAILFVLSQMGRIEEKEGNIPVAPAPQKQQAAAPLPVVWQPSPSRPPAPQDPAKYGMVVIEEGRDTLTQSEWDKMITDKVSELKQTYAGTDMQKRYDFIKEDPQKTDEKIKQINAKMLIYEEELRRDPNNKQIKGQLERLKMLKSIARGLIEIK